MRKGFTLIEMMLTLSIMVMLAGISAPIYLSFQAKNDLETANSVLISSLRRAQMLAQTMDHDMSWGVYLQERRLTVFAGETYNTRSSVYDEDFSLAPSVSFSGLNEIVFEKLSGETNNIGEIIINSNNNETRTITINQKGRLEF